MIPRVSVVIPTHNRAATLPRALDSVLAQSHRDFELILIDDGSTDETPELLERYRIRMGPIPFQILRQATSGVSRARNEGVRRARGEWVAFLDSDDKWLPDKLALQTRFAHRHPDLGLIHGNEIWIRRGTRVNPKRKHRKSGGNIFLDCLPLCVISPSAAMIRRRDLLEVGLFDESFPVCEDYDLWLRWSSTRPVGFIERPIIIKYGGHADQLSRRYVAMDYWRVKSLHRIWQTEILPAKHGTAVLAEIGRKAAILLAGYEKHGNLGSEYREIQEILQECRQS